MPRDLFAQLTASPESQNPAATGQEFTIDRGDEGSGLGRSRNANIDSKALSDLHPYVQTLSISDLDSCVALENATFPESERCSREKVNAPDGPTAALPTYAYSRPPDSASPMKKGTLIAQVIATKCASTTVTDESMEYPSDWRTRVSLSEQQGHQEHGRTIAVHSLAALPEFRGRGLGKIVMKSYMQRMESSGIADRIALLAHDHLIGK
ncbi:MAG: hypothetical protein Q9226_003942 [Calogaya cf. arnoldii]